jgi:hypothetical protein
MKKYMLIVILSVFHLVFASAQSPLWQGKGRIVISADGNEHDHDDWAGTPLTLAILSAKGLQNNVPLYIYSDHVWGSNHEHPGIKGVTPYQQMKESAVSGGRMFKFNKTRFLCAVDIPEMAYEALKDEINRSTFENPLFIIVSGPTQVIGEAIARSDRDKRKLVTLITMNDSWNNTHADEPYAWWENHSGWTLAEIKQQFANKDGGELKIVTIKNQNTYLVRNWTEYEWLLNAPERNLIYYRKGAWRWLFNRLCMSIKPVSGPKNYYAIDPSDAGKIIFLLTGIENTSPELCYEIMRNPPK